MAKFHVDSIQEWQPFAHDGVEFDLNHLSSHLVVFKADRQNYEFVVTYGLHCFTKDDSGNNIAYRYEDGRHGQMVCLERYEASKQLKGIIEKLDAATIYHTQGERFFTMRVLNSATGLLEPYKVCLAFYREHRLLRIHVTSAYFARTGEGSPQTPINKKGVQYLQGRDGYAKKTQGPMPQGSTESAETAKMKAQKRRIPL